MTPLSVRWGTTHPWPPKTLIVLNKCHLPPPRYGSTHSGPSSYFARRRRSNPTSDINQSIKSLKLSQNFKAEEEAREARRKQNPHCVSHGVRNTTYTKNTHNQYDSNNKQEYDIALPLILRWAQKVDHGLEKLQRRRVLLELGKQMARNVQSTANDASAPHINAALTRR